MGLHAAIIRLSPLTHEGEQRYKPYIVVDPRMVTPPFEKSWLRPCQFLRIPHGALGKPMEQATVKEPKGAIP